MTREEIKRILIEEITAIAPDAEPESVPDDADLREALDLDSMDMSNLLIALHERLGVDIPEADVRRLTTMDGALDYLAGKTAE